MLAAPDSTRRMQLLQQVADVVRTGLPDRVAAQSLDVYRVKESKVPEQWADNPVERTLIARLPLTDDGAS
ncbi:MAG: hypothetical protein ABEK75_06545 [Salinibacter sp.]